MEVLCAIFEAMSNCWLVLWLSGALDDDPPARPKRDQR